MAEIKSDNLYITTLIEKIKTSVTGDFEYYFNLSTGCNWYDTDCLNKAPGELINRIKEFLENLINGIKKGLFKAASNLVEEFQKIFNTLGDLIRDPFKTAQEIFKQAQNIIEGIKNLLGNLGNLSKVVFQNVQDFFTGGRQDRIFALGNSIGLFIGERVGNSIKGFLTGGPVAAMAGVITSIVEKAKEAWNFVVKTASLVGEKIKIGISKVEVFFSKLRGNGGLNVSEIRKLDVDKINNLKLFVDGKASEFRKAVIGINKNTFDAVEAGGVKLSKSGDYRDLAIIELEKSGKNLNTLGKDIGGRSNVIANHMISDVGAKMFPKQVAEILKDKGLSNINDPKNINWLSRATNTAHGQACSNNCTQLMQDAVKQGREVTKAEVLQIFSDAQKKYPPLAKNPGGIEF